MFEKSLLNLVWISAPDAIYKDSTNSFDWMRVSVDYQLGSLGMANFMWEGTGAHGSSEGSVTVR
nr:hypothetical protein [Tanacetum cinerariifolium]